MTKKVSVIPSLRGIPTDSKELTTSKISQRAASSIVLNLAEGAGRVTAKEQRRFFTIAYGSLRECKAVLDLLDLKTEAYECADRLGAHIYRLIQNAKGR